jgi:hypothetical protein
MMKADSPRRRMGVATIRRLLLIVPALALVSLPIKAGSVATAKPEEVGLSTERLQRVRELVQRHLDAHNVSGVVTLVARRGRIAHFEAQGMQDLEARKAMPKEARAAHRR